MPGLGLASLHHNPGLQDPDKAGLETGTWGAQREGGMGRRRWEEGRPMGTALRQDLALRILTRF